MIAERWWTTKDVCVSQRIWGTCTVSLCVSAFLFAAAEAAAANGRSSGSCKRLMLWWFWWWMMMVIQMESSESNSRLWLLRLILHEPLAHARRTREDDHCLFPMMMVANTVLARTWTFSMPAGTKPHQFDSFRSMMMVMGTSPLHVLSTLERTGNPQIPIFLSYLFGDRL